MRQPPPVIRPADVRERIRLRVVARLDELGMTAREFALRTRPGEPGASLDSWVSGILKGEQALSWKHFDAACNALGLSPSEMVREDGSELRELRPSEMAMLRYFQQWPTAIQDRWLKLLEYFSSSAADEEARRLLHEVQEMSAVERRVLRTYLASLQTHKPQQS